MSKTPLPSKSSEAGDSLAKARTTRPVARQRKDRPQDSTILLVDDDRAVRESLGRVLATEGWRVVSAASGEEALEQLALRQPDLMITDLRMADVSGWDLLFHEQMQRPDLPVFVITALPLPEVGGADAFAAEFFSKPLDLEALLAAVRHRLDVPQPASPSR